MKLKLLRMGKSYCNGPLNDPGLLERPWHIGEIREITDQKGYYVMAKYPGLFQSMKSDDDVFDKVGKKPKNKIYDDRITKPLGVK